MTDERWSRVKEIFSGALDVPPDRREAFLAQRCPDDESVRADVRSLLRSHDAADTFIETPAAVLVGVPLDKPAGGLQGQRVGPYLILCEIAHGGMGTVYLATRADGAYDKQVALKVIRRGLDTDEILARFRHERQTLAGLDHPNIARLLDGGTTDDGLPFFVMEYVEGVPIDRYCDDRRLTISERLELFRTVCAAVQAAHRNLVVHRDLKPDNILVTSEGVPKLVDFGIAKVLASSTGMTQTGAFGHLLTPEYASPEQIDGGPITTASDVFSLGVLLHELLTGRNPYRLTVACTAGAAGYATRQAVTQKPSAIVTQPLQVGEPGGTTRLVPADEISAVRRLSPSALRRRLAGDLDTIVSVAMRAEPERRYGSAEQLAEDIRRHLAGLPIAARKDSRRYRIARFVTRHAAAVAVGALIAVALLAAVVVVIWQGRVAAEQRDRARVEAAKAVRISSFLEEMLRAPDPVNQGRDVKLVDAVDRAARRLQADRTSDPEIQVPIRRALGLTYYNLGLYDAAEVHLRAALAALRSQSAEARAERASVEAALADVLSSAGKTPEADKLYVHALSVFDALGVRDDVRRADALNGYGQQLRERGDDAGAEKMYRESLDIRRRLLGNADVAVAESLNNLAVVMHARNNLAEAERLYRESLQIVRAARGDDHPGVPATLTNLASVVASQGNLAAAEPLYREALDIRRRLLGNDHPALTITMFNYADLLLSMGRYNEAIALSQDILARRGRTLPDRHPIVAAAYLVLGKSLLEQGDMKGAEAALREAFNRRQAMLPPGHWQTASAQSALGRCLAKEGRFPEAEPLLVGGFDRLNADRGPSHERTRDALANVVEMYDLWGKPDKAAYYRELQAKSGRKP